MKITIINGTNRKLNQTKKISEAMKTISQKSGYTTAIVSLENFDKLFRGKYVTYETADEKQKKDIKSLVRADLLIYIVPTYHSGIPSPLKNFFDTLKCLDCYDNKVILLVAGSDKNQDLSARQAQQVINGILSYNKAQSFVHPRISIVDFNNIDFERLQNQIENGVEYLYKLNKQY